MNTTTRPYRAAADTYLGAGWSPIPTSGKSPRVAGVSGHGSSPVTASMVERWRSEFGSSNVGLVLPPDVVGFDVDDYGDKHGADTLADLELKFGPLPETWFSTSRDGRSGIRLFRVPRGTVFSGQIGPHVDTVQHHHRNVTVWPSVHKSGNVYRWGIGDSSDAGWVLSEGTGSHGVPTVGELAELPDAWLNGLTRDTPQPRAEGLGPGDGASLLAGLAPGEPDARVERALGRAVAGLSGEHGSRYDSVRDDVARLLRAGEQGAVGVGSALSTLRRLYVAMVGPDRSDAGAEFDRHLKSGAELIAADPSAGFEDETEAAALAQDAEDSRVLTEKSTIRVRERARAEHGEERARALLATASEGVVDGEQFLSESFNSTPLWGADAKVLWAGGEGLMICGPQGVGKSTIVQKLALARAGITGPELFGFPVLQDDRPILYLAMDRPTQIRRSLARMVDMDDPGTLARFRKQFRFWKGPPPFDVASAPRIYADWLQKVGDGPGLVIVDSMKDVANGLSQDEVGSSLNTAMQLVLAHGTEYVALHHQRKANADNPKPSKMSDVYGSTWLTSGMGSIVLVWGSAGDQTVELTHLKQPQEVVGPLTVNHSHSDGASVSVDPVAQLLALASTVGSGGLTEEAAVRELFKIGVDDESYVNSKKSVRRRLDRLTEDGLLNHEPGVKGGAGGGGRASRWVVPG